MISKEKEICYYCGKETLVQRIEFALGIKLCRECCARCGVTWREKI